jgi:hypothetical protein
MDSIDDEPDNEDELHDEDMANIVLPSGARFAVHTSEIDYTVERCRRYQSDNSFQNISDMQDLDRLIMAELIVYRYSRWISLQKDYWGDAIDERTLNTSMKSLAQEIRLIKQSLSLDKKTRDLQRGEDSTSAYLAALRERAKAFGYTREKQLDKALELFNEIKARVTFWENTDEIEQVEQETRAVDVIKWLQEEAIPEYDAIDAHFRENEQKYWISKQ